VQTGLQDYLKSFLQAINILREGFYGAPYGPEPKPCTLFPARFSSSPNEYFLPKGCFSLHFVGCSGVVIGSKFTALAQKEARRGEREQN